MSFSTESICPICGGEFEVNTKGRRKEYCSKNCQEMSKFLSAFEDRFLKTKTFTKDAKRSMRSRVMSMLNTMNGK